MCYSLDAFFQPSTGGKSMEPMNTDESAVFKTVANASEQSWLASLLSQFREYRNPPAPVQVTAQPDPEAVGLLIELPSALGSMITSIRGMIEDWRHPRTYDVEAAEVEEIWGSRRYKTQVFSFIAYSALAGVAWFGPGFVTGAAATTETIIPIATNTPIVIPKFQPDPAPVPKAQPKPPTTPKPST
jgi:hypothetical protein